jgi:hypothetical protein
VPPIATLDSSPETTPLKEAVPVAVAEVEPLYVLLTPVNPVTERAFFETVLEDVATLTLVAPVLLKTILPE